MIMTQPAKHRGFGWWLGRQFGYIKKAVNTSVPHKQIFRRNQVQEEILPENPNITLRRVVTDELIIKHKETK